MPADWRNLLVRTARGTILAEVSKQQFLQELNNLLWMNRTGVWDMMTTNSEGVKAFLDAHSLSILDCDPVKVLSLFEKELASEQKHAKAVADAAERTKKQAAKALHKAFNILSPNDHEADRSSVLAIAATEMKVEPSAYPMVMQQLKEFIADSDVFGAGPAVKSTYVRLKNEKGEETGKMSPTAPFQGNGASASGGSKLVSRFTKTAKKYVGSKDELGAAKKWFGQPVGDEGQLSEAQLQEWKVATPEARSAPRKT